jgi:hypothetical protein
MPAMTTRISTAARTAMADAVVDLLDGGAGPGYVEFRTGAQPASVATAASGTLLATLVLSDPAFDAAVAGVAALDVTPLPTDTSADTTGTAGWFRAYDSNAVAVMDGSITATGGGGDMTLNTVALTAGVAVEITAWSVTMPAG